MALLKELSINELTIQWQVFEIRITRLEKHVNRMYSSKQTRKDLVDILSGRGEQLKEDLLEQLDLQQAVEYWLKDKGADLEYLRKYNIKPKSVFFSNTESTET